MSTIGSTLTAADATTGLDATATRFLWVSAGAAPGGDGSADHPFNTIQAAVNVATAGTAVMVEAGTYVENIKFPSKTGGEPGAPIQLISSDGQGAAKIIAADNSIAAIKGLGVHDITVKGFEVQGGLNGIQFSQSGDDTQDLVHNIVVQGNIVSNTVQDGIKIDQADNVKIVDNTVAHTGGEGVDFVAVNNSVIGYNDISYIDGVAGTFTKGGSTNDLVIGNNIHDILKDGIGVGGWTTAAYFRAGFDTYEASNITVTGNTVTNVGLRAVDVLGALHSEISGNQLEANPGYFTATEVGSGANKAMTSSDIDISNNVVIAGAGKALNSVDPGSTGVNFHDNQTSGDLNLVTGPSSDWLSAEAALVKTALGGAVPTQAQASSAPVPVGDALIYNGTSKSETLVGAGAHNALYGGGGNDSLVGGDGSDTLDGGAGADTMVGGNGDDTYVVDSSADMIVEQPNGGTDTVISTMNTLHLDGWVNVENATFTGVGAVSLLGNALDNSLVGGVGNDSLDGGTGADTLVGGLGDDIYYVHDGRDVVVEQPGGGTDTVRSDVSYVLPDNVENLFLTKGGLTGVGNELANHINASDGNDALYGGDGADTLQGAGGDDTLDGGLGADSLLGGAGNDTYFVDNVGDVVIEAANAGTDTVYTSLAAYTLPINVENLTGVDDGGQTLTGNAAANVITGAAGNDTLHGGGGADTMIGGAGDDTYYVELASEKVVEAPGGGYDTVILSNGAWVPDPGQEIEKIVAVAGTGGMTLHGNEFSQLLVGNAGANVFYGGGGVDTFQGGAGNDTYYVDNSADVIVENANEGNDNVVASVSYTLSANVEALGMSTAGHTATGNDQANTIVGSTGSDTIVGAGGNDALFGGGGTDTFVFAPGSGADTIGDFASGDVIDISAYLAAGAHPTITFSSAGAVIQLSATDSITVAHLLPTALVATATGYGTTSDAAAGAVSTSAVATAAATPLSLTGTPGNDSLVGGSAADKLDGLGGVDTLVGGAGNDLYFVHDSRDQVVEAAGGGIDEVHADVSFTLAANVENLLLMGAGLVGTGNDLANKITGASGGDQLYGGGGADTLLGGDGNDTLDGGTGGDSMLGGKGDDVYVVDDPSDVVIENGGEGYDTVRTSLAAYTLPGSVEALVGTSAAGQTLSGNTLDNVISGGAGNDTLHGGGGADTLAGGAGNDTYYIEDAREVVKEAPGGGYDTVILSNGAWTPGAGQEIEKIVAAAGTAGIALHGNEFNQLLVGNDGANLLDGGAGVDTMQGGAGNDTYIVNDSRDVVVEAAGGGNDLVKASVNFMLPDNVETLMLTAPGLTGTGNSAANVIIGTSGSDTLIGGGGSDTLTGGQGADTFVFQHLSDRGDIITDFQAGVDKLDVHALLAELGGDAHLTFAHTAKGMEVYVDHAGAHDELVLLQGLAGSSLASHDFIV